MKYSIKSIYDKFTAMIILISVTVITAGCVLGVYYLYQYGFYKNGVDSVRQNTWLTKIKEDESEVEDYLYAYFNDDDKSLGSYNSEGYTNNKNSIFLSVYDSTGNIVFQSKSRKYSKDESNISFLVSDTDGSTVIKNYSDKDFSFNSDEDYQFKYEKNYSIGENNGTITCYLRNELTARDSYRATNRFIDLGNSFLKYIIIFVLVISIVILLVMMSLIAFGAGDVQSDGQISMSFIDKLPFDVCTVGLLGTLIVAWLSIRLTEIADSNIVLFNVVVFFVVVIMVLVLLLYLSTFSVRLKMGNLLRNTLLYRFYSWIAKNTKRIKRLKKFKKAKKEKTRKDNSSLYFRNLIITVALLTVAELGVLLYFVHQETADQLEFMHYVTYWAISRVISIPIIVVAAMNFAYVYNTSKRLAEGNLDEPENTYFMFKGFRMYNKNLEQIRKEISKSIESEMKNERLKNEMITNLSHDIKTPLTAIIGYASLLKDSNKSPDEEKSYIEGIDRQSEKLRKLLENLIESSKLSNGDIVVQKEKMNVGLILSQIVGEFQYMLDEYELKLVCDEPETPACISADGDLLWRIIDNLMSNICKYAQKGTDVYLDAEITHDKVRIILQNTSATTIETDGDELLERFVRDDSSRHTEGDGLGLSIAKRLAELQGGKMELSVDGNIFKASLLFDRTYE
ncbi:MAG: HAMP domain-containing histidine kinase [Clostridiales bacterium]|nr:HAMP domain-containing histidine kinase [Clostridiales bacterium]